MIKIEEVTNIDIGQLALLSAADLYDLKEKASEAFESIKRAKEWIDTAIIQKYQDRLDYSRASLGKENGIINIADGNCVISQDIPKRIDWDQNKLAVIYENIRAAGSNPAEYIDVSYKVPERKYSGWPEHLKSSFETARILANGKPRIDIKIGGANE